MRSVSNGPLAHSIELYLAHKRSLGKLLTKEGATLHRLNKYLIAQGVVELGGITPEHLEHFVASRPRHSPRSHNTLIGALRRLFDWLVAHEMLPVSPLRCEARRVTPGRRPFLFNPEQARRLLDVAGQLPSNSRAQARGETYTMIFGILYGLGLRVGEVSRLCHKDVDLENQLLLIRQTKFGKDRFVPFGPRMASAIADFLQHQESYYGALPPDYPVFSFDKHRRTPVGANTISWTFHKLIPKLNLIVPVGVAPPHLSLPSTFVCREYTAAVVPNRSRSDVAFV